MPNQTEIAELEIKNNADFFAVCPHGVKVFTP